MLQVFVCIGNACEIKGSYEVIRIFKDLIKENYLEDKVEIIETYCQGHCCRGVSVKVGGEYIVNISALNAKENFENYILENLLK